MNEDSTYPRESTFANRIITPGQTQNQAHR